MGKGMEPDQKLLEELKYLVSKRHKWYRNTLRAYLAHCPDDVVQKGTWRQLKVGVYSNGIRAGQNEVADRMLEIVQTMLPDANINSLQLSRNVQCAPHRDARILVRCRVHTRVRGIRRGSLSTRGRKTF